MNTRRFQYCQDGIHQNQQDNVRLVGLLNQADLQAEELLLKEVEEIIHHHHLEILEVIIETHQLL